MTQPRVRDGRIGREFTSAILPPRLKRAASVDALIPRLYFKGVPAGDFREVLQANPWPLAKGLCACNAVRLMESRWNDCEVSEKRDLGGKRHVYGWVDRI